MSHIATLQNAMQLSPSVVKLSRLSSHFVSGGGQKVAVVSRHTRACPLVPPTVLNKLHFSSHAFASPYMFPVQYFPYRHSYSFGAVHSHILPHYIHLFLPSLNRSTVNAVYSTPSQASHSLQSHVCIYTITVVCRCIHI